MHVSILSVCSFVGRLLSGGLLIPRTVEVCFTWSVLMRVSSRRWVRFLSQVCPRQSGSGACSWPASFFLSPRSALSTFDYPHLLGFVSGLSGLGYGFLFGVFPSIVTEAFGIRGLSQNWGFMTLAPVISSNVFNLFYGTTYDRHSVIEPGGERACHEGLDCYRAAYWVTFGAGCVGLVMTLWAIRHERAELAKEEQKRRLTSMDR